MDYHTAQLVKHGYSDNPIYDELLWKLSELAGLWRRTKDETVVTRYHHILLSLLELGYDEALDAELELPDHLMPSEYLE